MYFNYMYSMNMIIFLLLFLILYLFKESFFMLLISLEFMLIFMLMMFMYQISFEGNDWMFIYFLVMGVCESVIGITLMISMVHDYGNENLKVMNLMW